MMKEVNFASTRGINDNRLVRRTSGFIITSVLITFVFLARVSQSAIIISVYICGRLSSSIICLIAIVSLYEILCSFIFHNRKVMPAFSFFINFLHTKVNYNGGINELTSEGYLYSMYRYYYPIAQTHKRGIEGKTECDPRDRDLSIIINVIPLYASYRKPKNFSFSRVCSRHLDYAS